jgi:V-type H+-transporting ATPase subunit a
MGWFRSEEMEYVQVIVHENNAHAAIGELGMRGSIQFRDLNQGMTPLARCEQHRIFEYFLREVTRCDELERKLRFFEAEMQKYGIEADENYSMDEWLLALESGKDSGRPSSFVLDELEGVLNARESELIELNAYFKNFTQEFNEQVELKHVLQKGQQFYSIVDEHFDANRPRGNSNDQNAGLLESQDGGFLETICGVVNKEDEQRFRRMIFRTSRGNALIRCKDIEDPILDPTTAEGVDKVMFMIMFSSQALKKKILAICRAFNAHVHSDLPNFNDFSAVSNRLREVNEQIKDRSTVINTNRENCRRLLRNEIGMRLRVWNWQVRREKIIFHTLNKFSILSNSQGAAGGSVSSSAGGSMLIGEGWVIKKDREDANKSLRGIGGNNEPCMMQIAERWPGPAPTYFETNKVTSGYQALVDTYGIPRYGEANPAMSTFVTFPFLFGVMYGDIGHAFLLFCTALTFILMEDSFKKIKGEIFQMAFGVRYMLLMMSSFAIYAGFIYNDIFSLTLDLFGTTWKFENKTADMATHQGPVDNVYAFGMDPEWHTSENSLAFYNSYKMKVSVVIGITQMTFGLILRLMNSIYFKSPIDFFCESIPMLVFMLCLFGYLVLMIIMKWCIDWNEFQALEGGYGPPSLLTMLINMALSPGSVTEGTALYAGQGPVQGKLLLTAVCMVPIMLFPKPLLVYYSQDGHGDAHGEEGHAHHTLGDLFVHQGIETIEFVLGCVSNTASYLRLWALSLAHAELAEVFWEKAMSPGIQSNNAVIVVIAFAIFFAITTGVLLLMDALECCLHALRLQWVEFQNKFFKADGYKFEPLSFKKILEKEER